MECIRRSRVLMPIKLTVCVTDGELSFEDQITLQSVPGTPTITMGLINAVTAVPLGSVDFPIGPVIAQGIPAPSYQWQYLVYERSNTTNSSIGGNSTKRVDAAHEDYMYLHRRGGALQAVGFYYSLVRNVVFGLW